MRAPAPEQTREGAVAGGGALLSVRDLRVAFQARRGLLQAVDGISFSVQPGEVLAIVGPNGAGKTTLLSIIAGTQRASAGTVAPFGDSTANVLEIHK